MPDQILPGAGKLTPIAIAIALASCGGGGGGSSSTAALEPESITRNVTAAGVITGFGSVFVDGIKYEVENGTVVSIEDEGDDVGDDSALRMGMKVRVRATETDGVRVADRIEYDEDLKGPATDINPDSLSPGLGSFSVVHQTVIVDSNTLFDNDVGDNNGDGTIDIRDLELPGGGRVVVEVSGLPTADGFIATRIDRVNGAAGVPGVDGDELEIKGFVDEVAADGSSFSINNAIFLVTDNTIFEDGLSADDSLLGLFVEVKADEDNGDLIAVRVEREDDVGDNDGDGDSDDDDRFGEFEIKGILISVDNASNPALVTIGGTTLEVSNTDSLEGLVGSLIELEGRFDENGVLILEEAKPEVENSVRTEDRVFQVNLDENSITTRLGLVITPGGSSRVEDDVADDEEDDHLTPEQFIARLAAEDHIRARGFPDANGDVQWTRVERRDQDKLECRLRGPVESIEGADSADFSFDILGITIDVSRISDDEDFQGNNDMSLGREAFFNELGVGDVVQAKSDEAGVGCEAGILTARTVEFEADDGVARSGANSSE